MSEANPWGRFYQTLNRLGPRLLTGIPDGLEQYIRQEAEGSDSFWSSALEHDFSYWRDGDRERAVRLGLEDWVENVRQHLSEIFGDDSLIRKRREFPSGITAGLRTTMLSWLMIRKREPVPALGGSERFLRSGGSRN